MDSLHIIVNLAGLLIAIIFFFYIIQKIKMTKVNLNKDIKVINSLSIGAKEKIILLEVNKQLLLIGATQSSLNTLHVFQDDLYKSLLMEVEEKESINSF